MNVGIRNVTAGTIDASAWTPFGWLPVPDTDAADGAQRLTFEWGDPHVNVISHGPEEVTRSDGGLVCSRLYRHDTHTQVLLALDGPSVLAVAPASAETSPTPVQLRSLQRVGYCWRFQLPSPIWWLANQTRAAVTARSVCFVPPPVANMALRLPLPRPPNPVPLPLRP
jgi:hypothetical protein